MRLVRSMLRSLKMGKMVLRVKQAARFGIRVELATFLAKRRLLPIVKSARPLSADCGSVDCYMLLNEARFLEGLWSL